MEIKRKTFIEGQNFNSLAAHQKGTILKKKYRVQKIVGVTSIAAGAILAGSGLGLFIHNKYGGSHSRSAQYSLMFGGMLLLSEGIALNAFSELNNNTAKAYLDISNNKYSSGTPLNEFYKYSGARNKAKKTSAKTLYISGVSLLTISLSLFALSIYSFYDSKGYVNDKYDEKRKDEDYRSTTFFGNDKETLEMIGTHFLQIFTLIPGGVTFAGGVVMIVFASTWSRLKTKPSLFTLKTITPMINPITKTYGISMGFSY